MAQAMIQPMTSPELDRIAEAIDRPEWPFNGTPQSIVKRLLPTISLLREGRHLPHETTPVGEPEKMLVQFAPYETFGAAIPHVMSTLKLPFPPWEKDDEILAADFGLSFDFTQDDENPFVVSPVSPEKANELLCRTPRRSVPIETEAALMDRLLGMATYPNEDIRCAGRKILLSLYMVQSPLFDKYPSLRAGLA